MASRDYIFTAQDLRVDTLDDTFQVSIRSLSEVEAQIIRGDNSLIDEFIEFRNLTPEELRIRFDNIRTELANSSILTMLSAVESFIRRDYERKRSKKGLFRTLYSTYAAKTPLEDILDAWKTSDPTIKNSIGEYSAALKLRHWLAHGRYWTVTVRKAGYSPSDIQKIANDVILKISESSI